MTSADRILAATKYLRRKYAGKLEDLKILAESVAAGAFDKVTITGNAYEGGSASGEVTFAALEYLSAVEDVIADMDDSVAALAAPMVMHATFAHRPVLT